MISENLDLAIRIAFLVSDLSSKASLFRSLGFIIKTERKHLGREKSGENELKTHSRNF
jgi:hypothetical protein